MSKDTSKSATLRVHPEKRTRFFKRRTGPMRDPRLSLKAKAVWLHLITKPQGWVIRKPEIQNTLGMGREATANALKELQQTGYMVRHRGKLFVLESSHDAHRVPGSKDAIIRAQISDGDTYLLATFEVLEHPNLSAQAKALQYLALCHSANTTAYNLAGQTKESPNTMRVYMKELEAEGYLVRHEGRHRGQFSGMEYYFLESLELAGKVPQRLPVPKAAPKPKPLPTTETPALAVFAIHQEQGQEAFKLWLKYKSSQGHRYRTEAAEALVLQQIATTYKGDGLAALESIRGAILAGYNTLRPSQSKPQRESTRWEPTPDDVELTPFGIPLHMVPNR